MIIQNESERKYITDILASDLDAEFREEIRSKTNGEYAFQICRKCKRYLSKISGNVTTAKIVESCRECEK